MDTKQIEVKQHLDKDDLEGVWSTLEADKGEVIKRSETYARWTLPYVCPEDNTSDSTQRKSFVYNGARYASHLANRVVDTMFPSDRPFFALSLTPESELKMAETTSPEDRAALKDTFRESTALIEKLAMRKMGMTHYRPVAVQAAEHVIVTGNACILRNDEGERVVYGIKDFCVRRDLTGNLLHAILRDSKKFDSLDADVQKKVIEKNPAIVSDKETTVTLYTYFYRENDKWHSIQGIDTCTLEDTVRSYSDEAMPLIALTWSLSRGDSYGRGLVEAHATMFNQIDVLTESAIDLVGIASDIKWLVNPASGIDIEEWNNAPRGAYVPGKEGDVMMTEFRGRDELEVIHAQVLHLNRELGMIFLSGNSSTRDAERVTAEEIRFNARELNTAFGGIYSRLAVSWQQREADYLIAKLDSALYARLKNFEVTVVTGVESLSREGKLDDFARAITDLQMLDAVPEDIRGQLDIQVIAKFIFTNRGASFTDFVLSEDKMRQKQEAAQAAQQQQLDAEGQQQVAVEAGKQATQE